MLTKLILDIQQAIQMDMMSDNRKGHKLVQVTLSTDPKLFSLYVTLLYHNIDGGPVMKGILVRKTTSPIERRLAAYLNTLINTIM